MISNNRSLIEQECCVGPDGCFREQVLYRCLHDQPESPVQYSDTRSFVSGYFLQSATLQQAYKSTRFCLVRWAMLGTRYYIHHISMACLRLHCLRQSAACFLAGSGPWHKHPCLHLPLLLKPWAPLHLPRAGHGHTRSRPKSLQLSPRSDRIVLEKQ